jgi:hypothetical protein
MKTSKISGWKVSTWEKGIVLAGLIGYGLIVYRYRFQMGDFGDFVSAGKMIWENVDPYSQLMYVNSPVSAVIAYGLSRALPFLFVPAFWQILNIVGLAFFFRTILKSQYHRALPIIFSIFAFFNVTRSLFANVQVTGLVLGMIAIGMTLIKQRRHVLICMIPIWLAAEVKPQLALGFIAVLLFQGKVQKLRIFILGLLVVSSHAIVELKFSGGINRLWIEKLLKYSNASLTEGYEISFWKSLAIYSGQEGSIRILSTFFLVATLVSIMFFALKKRLDIALFLAMFFPFQNTYLHLYDLAPIGILYILALHSFRDFPIIIGTGIFLQFFPLVIETQILAGLICAATVFIITRKNQGFLQLVVSLVVSVFAFVLIFFLLRSQSQELQIAIALVAPTATLLALYIRKFVSPLDSELMSR